MLCGRVPPVGSFFVTAPRQMRILAHSGNALDGHLSKDKPCERLSVGRTRTPGGRRTFRWPRTDLKSPKPTSGPCSVACSCKHSLIEQRSCRVDVTRLRRHFAWLPTRQLVSADTDSFCNLLVLVICRLRRVLFPFPEFQDCGIPRFS